MRIEVRPNTDGLEAKLVIADFDAARWRAEFAETASLHEHLLSLGLNKTFLVLPQIDFVHATLTESAFSPSSLPKALESAQAAVIASGTPPRHEEIEGLLFQKSYFSQPEEIASIRERISRQEFQMLQDQINPSYIVAIGQIILNFQSIREGKQGLDVHGNPIAFNPYTALLPDASPSISRFEKKWVARKNGILILEGGQLKILSLKETLSDCLRISEDKMQVSLSLSKDMEFNDEAKPTVERLKAILAHLGIVGRFDEKTASEALEGFFNFGRESCRVLLSGIPVKESQDGRLEVLVDPEPDLPPAESIGKIDYKQFTFFKSVQKGQVLAKVVPPNPGEPGKDVFGNFVFPQSRALKQVLLGANTVLDPQNPLLVIANCPGKIVVDKDVPIVVETLKVGADVSLKTGNISFPGSIDVQGDVKDNLTIDAKGDIGISGTVEDGSITSDGSIVVLGGFAGTGRGVIKSKFSSVTIGHIRNQRIESHSNIIVYNEIVNATLMARNAVLMKSTSHSVVGGHTLAFSHIDIFNAGNELGMKTIFEVGKDFEVERELNSLRDRLKEMRGDLGFLKSSFTKLSKMVKFEGGAKLENRVLEQRAKGVLQFLALAESKLKLQIDDLEKRLYNEGESHIAIRGTTFPGTVLKFKKKIIIISENLFNKKWTFRGSQAGLKDRFASSD